MDNDKRTRSKDINEWDEEAEVDMWCNKGRTRERNNENDTRIQNYNRKKAKIVLATNQLIK